MAGTYKSQKEAFVSGMTGSSITHVNLVSLVALASVTLYAALRTRLPETRHINFILSWILLILPLLLSMTVLADRPLFLSFLLLAPSGLLLLVPQRGGGTPLPSSQPSSLTKETEVPLESRRLRIRPLPALTTYRAHMMLMTILAILAVDFPVFPRSLAKCETFGVSLMDLGVGSFVFSQGIVSAIPLVKDPAYLTAPLWTKLVNVIRKSSPVIALGLIRVVLVKASEYPEHETEYGRHWNFFVTLALLPILQVLFHPIIIYLPIAFIGILVAVGQQIALSQFGLKNYVLNAPRTSLISANKEGIVSLSGYLAIQLLGLSAGTLILPPSPSIFRRRKEVIAEQIRKRRDSNASLQQKTNANKDNKDLDPESPRQLGKTATELCSYAILWWSLLGLSRALKIDGSWGPDGGVSRRMVNLSYILWVAAFNITFLLAYLVVMDILFFPGPKSKKEIKRAKSDSQLSPNVYSTFQNRYTGEVIVVEGNPPELLEAINKHSLVLFLIANIFTGIINLTMKTMYASDLFAMFVISAYASSLCGIAWIWKNRATLIPGI